METTQALETIKAVQLANRITSTANTIKGSVMWDISNQDANTMAMAIIRAIEEYRATGEIVESIEDLQKSVFNLNYLV